MQAMLTVLKIAFHDKVLLGFLSSLLFSSDPSVSNSLSSESEDSNTDCVVFCSVVLMPGGTRVSGCNRGTVLYCSVLFCNGLLCTGLDWTGLDWTNMETGQ